MTEKTDSAKPGVVLIADDDHLVRRSLVRVVAGEGHAVHAVADGDEAVAAFAAHSIDLVLSDIDMPGRNGIALLKAIRERDLDVPVILLTGAPRLDTAIAAVEFGATRYLTKPVDLTQLRDTIRWALGARRLAQARRELATLDGGSGLEIGDLAGVAARFDKALAALYMVWQPLVRWSTRSTFAYEALMRSSEPTMLRPDALLDAGDRLGRIPEIGRRVRALVAERHADDGDTLIFVNVDTRDLTDESLYSPRSPLAAIAHRVVLEITERARLETVPNLVAQLAKLRAMGFRLAIDDIGAGYAGLTSFAALEPHFMKLDRALVQQLYESRTKTRLVGAMIQACADLGVQVIGEGVETAAERDALVELGCDVLQGYLFAKPDRELAPPLM